MPLPENFSWQDNYLVGYPSEEVAGIIQKNHQDGTWFYNELKALNRIDPEYYGWQNYQQLGGVGRSPQFLTPEAAKVHVVKNYERIENYNKEAAENRRKEQEKFLAYCAGQEAEVKRQKKGLINWLLTFLHLK